MHLDEGTSLVNDSHAVIRALAATPCGRNRLLADTKSQFVMRISYVHACWLLLVELGNQLCAVVTL